VGTRRKKGKTQNQKSTPKQTNKPDTLHFNPPQIKEPNDLNKPNSSGGKKKGGSQRVKTVKKEANDRMEREVGGKVRQGTGMRTENYCKTTRKEK